MKKELEEQFNKLSQLDRIEYRQKEDRISKRFEEPLHTSIFSAWVSILSFLGIIELVFYTIKGISIFSMNDLRWILIAFAVSYGLSFIDLFLDREGREMKKLNSEYFKLEIKKK